MKISKVTDYAALKVMEFTIQFCARSMSSEPFLRFSLNFTQLSSFETVCRTHDSATLTQGLGSMLGDSAAGDLPSYLIFDMQHHVEDLFEVVQIMSIGTKCPGQGSNILHMLTLR